MAGRALVRAAQDRSELKLDKTLGEAARHVRLPPCGVRGRHVRGEKCGSWHAQDGLAPRLSCMV